MNPSRSYSFTGDQRALINAFLREGGLKPAEADRIPKRATAGEAPLSFAQQRLWFLDQLVPGNPFYNCDTTVPIPALVNYDALQRSINTLVARHDSLRTVFQEASGQPVQRILPHLSVPVERVDLRTLPLKGRRAEAYRLAREEALQPFRLDQGPLIRVRLLTLGDADHLLVLIMHHIISDGWSLGVFWRELQACYAAFCASREPVLEPLPIQYADFAVWQRAFLSGDRLERLLQYWRDKLRGMSELPLLTDRRRPSFPSFQGAFEKVSVPLEINRRLKLLAQAEGATAFMVLLTAYKLLLWRYSQADDVVVGSPIANRNRAELEGLIGFFVNTMVLRTSLAGRPTFRELVRRVKQTALDAYAHQDLPFEALVDDIQPERDLSRNPLFQVTFQFFTLGRSAGPGAAPQAQAQTGPVELQRGTSKFDLRLDMWETEAGFGGQFEYSLDLFDETSVRKMVAQFNTILQEASEHPDSVVDDLPLKEKLSVVSEVRTWNESTRFFPRDRSVYDLFLEQARRHPGNTALSFGSVSWSYAELAAKAGQVSAALKARAIARGEKVAICLDRSPEFIAAMLGILQAGCAYVPIDPEFPEGRRNFILADSGARFVIASERSGVVAPESCGLVAIEPALNGESALASPEPPLRGADELAYVMYTSGSTGTPKGVLIPHRGISRLALNTNYLEVRPGDRIAHLSNVAFDASTFEIWAALLNGACMVGIRRDVALSPLELRETVVAERVSIMFLTTALFHQIADELPTAFSSLRVLLVGGSESDPQRFLKVLRAGAPGQLQHVYGPTENTTFSTFYILPSQFDPNRRIPIGRPIANSTAFILDSSQQLVPAGVPGELYVGGEGLALGYLNRRELDRLAFISHPLVPGGKLYRTGDRARLRDDGEIEFLGRVDNQVKIRGFRVELSEIESVLRRHEAVKEGLVLLGHGHGEREPRICAYVSLKDLARGADATATEDGTEDQVVDQWRRIYDQVIYGSISPSARVETSPTFNTTGWKDSFTGEDLSQPVMREQVDQTLSRILQNRPKRVLEIGCGTGLLMHRLLPEVDRYVGADFSETALEFLRRSLTAAPDLASKVQLFHREANDFSGLERGGFDVVVLNSIVQYFPSLTYLEEVLRKAVEVLAPSGRIFIGDVRCLPLLETFHLSVAAAQGEGDLDIKTLKQRLASRMDQEQELCIHPDFFLTLGETMPRLRRVAVQQKRGSLDSELTRYRFDAVLDLGDRSADLSLGAALAWTSLGSITTLAQKLRDAAVLPLTVTGIPNRRLERDHAIRELVDSPDVPDLRTLRERADSSGAPNHTFDPEEIWKLGAPLGLEVLVCWTPGRETELFDALFVPTQDSCRLSFPAPSERKPGARELANDPIKGRFLRNIVPELREFVQRILPDYMHPAHYVLVTEFPLNANGKIDTRQLPAPDSARSRDGLEFVKPRNPMEERLAAIFSKVLGIDAVDVNENFFTSLGGNSLLATQVISQLQLQLKVRVPLRYLFEAPTVASFADRVEGCLRQGSPALESITAAPADAVSVSVDGLSDQDVDRMLEQLLQQQDR